MCTFFDAQVPKQCREDDADEVTEKERLNFCEWFQPGGGVFNEQRYKEEQQAKLQLAGLFDDVEAAADDADTQLSDAEDLFR